MGWFLIAKDFFMQLKLLFLQTGWSTFGVDSYVPFPDSQTIEMPARYLPLKPK